VLERILLKLFHIDAGIQENTENIIKKNQELVGLRQEKKVHDKALETARAAQAKARTSVLQKEKQIKKEEKSLEAKVRECPHYMSCL